MAPIEYVDPVLLENWSEDYGPSEHWNKYWNAVSAPSDDELPKGSTEHGETLFLNEKRSVQKTPVQALIDHWQNAQFMHSRGAKMQWYLIWRREFPPEYYAILNRY